VTGFPLGLFWINSNGDQVAQSRGVDDAPKMSDGVAYGSGFIDDFGRCTETLATQQESL
jgi:hypothetical protein